MLDRQRIELAATNVAKANGADLALLFGSYARGTATHRSDVDLIFVEDTQERFLARLERYLGPLADELHTNIEALVYTPDEFRRIKQAAFGLRVMAEGVVLYESGKLSA